jgi:triacylglycerol esterase/lipase EstA (alpha/beta hydrolase family)
MTDFNETLRLLRRHGSPFDSQNVPLKTLRTSPKVKKIVEDAGLVVKPKLQKTQPTTELKHNTHVNFQKPQTDEEWKAFHKTNEINMQKAYAAPEGYFKDGNKLYIAGTRDTQDVMDWIKIPLGSFRNSKIYKNIEPVFRDDKDINTVIGHSAGGSAALELEKNYPDRKITSITYNAPVFERADPEKLLNKDKKPMRFAVSGDPVSMFDMNAQTTFKAPDFNLEKVQNMTNVMTDPSLGNISKVAQKGMPDPTLGLHSMSGTYSNPSKPMDFVKSGLEGAAVGKAVGII